MLERKTNYPEIDTCKGIAILLIILGHSFCTFPFNLAGALNSLSPYVNGFALALFSIVSGFLFSTEENWLVFLQKKNKRLLIPYLFFGLMTIGGQIAFHNFTRTGTQTIIEAFYKLGTGYYYWYLYVLFLMMVIYKMKSGITKHYWGDLVLAASALLLFCSGIPLHETISRLLHYLPFFIMGNLIRRNKFYWNLPKQFSIFTIILMLYVITIEYRNLSIRGISLLSEICGGASAIIFSFRISKYHKIQKFLSFFGRYSLQYYLNHLAIMLPCSYMLMLYPNAPSLLMLITVFTASVSASTILLLVERKIKWIGSFCGLPKK